MFWQTLYVIRRSRTVIWPLLLCMALSAALAITGYGLTTRYIARTVQEFTRGTSSK